ncbi:hypothetical protein IYZ83_003530 [Wolbachia pipientis]|uniref:hypothetical protein n=1 Tax=Wolbachia pipientis TaxID=955 RepID=UPI001BD9271A|nr:hypothetical protein [Wolbachia pipientis]UIP91231.1 hypothetical protein IYZ83_003530 [Wolbachia pipientis]
MTRIICVASVVYFKIRFFFKIYYHENSNFPFAAGLVLNVKPLMHFSFLLISSVGKITPTLSTSAEFSISVGDNWLLNSFATLTPVSHSYVFD